MDLGLTVRSGGTSGSAERAINLLRRDSVECCELARCASPIIGTRNACARSGAVMSRALLP